MGNLEKETRAKLQEKEILVLLQLSRNVIMEQPMLLRLDIPVVIAGILYKF